MLAQALLMIESQASCYPDLFEGPNRQTPSTRIQSLSVRAQMEERKG